MITEKHTCEERVFRNWSEHTCGITARFEHGGRWYCKRHHPPSAKAKAEARDKAYRDRLNEEVAVAQKRRKQEDQMRSDHARMEAMQEAQVDTIYLDDGKIIDVGGKHSGDLRAAIDQWVKER
jgi:hypothetical protein